MSRTVTALIGLLTLLCLAGLPRPTESRAADPDKAKKTCTLTVVHENNSLPSLVMVTLYQEGKIIRSRELKYFFDDKVTWDKLPEGTYEAHFEAPGYEKLVKRVFLAEGDDGVKVYVQLDKQPVVLGAGTSVQEILKQLEQLKKANAELQAKVEALQAEVNQLKKK
jgi:hypothetical protein